MLISSLAALILSVTYWPIVPEEPSTFALVVAGGATLGVYSVSGRYFRGRRARLNRRKASDGNAGLDTNVRKAA